MRFRLLLLVLLVSAGAAAQRKLTPPLLRNGAPGRDQSLLRKKTDDPRWNHAGYGAHRYVILQWDHILSEAERTDLGRRGIRLSQYMPGNAWLAELEPDADPLAGKPADIFAIPQTLKWRPGDWTGNASAPGIVAVNFFGSMPRETVEKELYALGASPADTRIKPRQTVFVLATYDVVKRIAELPFVVSLAPERLKDVPLNDNNRNTHGVEALYSPSQRNLTGRGVVVGIGDDADPSSHVDFAGRLVLRTVEPVNFHGTHVAGTAVGGGILNPRYRGMAPGARLVVNAFSDIIVNAENYMHDYDMLISNNSYYNGADNCPGDGAYDPLSAYIDDQLYRNPALLHVFASGNDGRLTCGVYPNAYATVKSGFQTGKNVLSVGAINTVTYALKTSSSRGPASDGRLKPEVVCGGDGVTSTTPYNTYAIDYGTSMAAPVATGVLSLLAQRYRQLHGNADPAGAFLKALAANGAEDMGNPGPDYSFGFGRLNGLKSVEMLEKNQYFHASLPTGGTANFTVPAVPDGAKQLKILLAWSDPAGMPYGASALVNDLDLTVTGPNGTLHHPLVLNPDPAQVSATATEGVDHLNNIEQVVINTPAAGDYAVQVTGTAVPQGPQDFYVVYQWVTDPVTLEFPFGDEALVPGDQEYIRWDAAGPDINTFSLAYSTDNGASWNPIASSIAPATRCYLWTVPAVNTSQARVRITRDGEGSDTSTLPFVILGQPVLTVTNPCRGYAQLSWTRIAAADRYDVMQLSGDTMRAVKSTTDTSFLVPGLNKDSTYWFSVRAVYQGKPGQRALAGSTQPYGGACTITALDNDIALDSIRAPLSGRLFTPSQPGVQAPVLTLRIPGSKATTSPLNFFYQVNGGPVVAETVTASVPGKTSATYGFSPTHAYDFSAPGLYQIKAWVQYAADTLPANDTVTSVVKTLRNEPLTLNPSFFEGFESATAAVYLHSFTGLDSLDRADFKTTNGNGRLNTFFNTGFPRTGNRAMTLDVSSNGTSASDSLLLTFNLSNYSSADQIWLDLFYKKQSQSASAPGNQIWIRGSSNDAWLSVKDFRTNDDATAVYLPLNVNVTETLGKASPAQAVSSAFQVKVGYDNNAAASSDVPGASTGNGITIDDVTLTKTTNDAGFRALLAPSFRNYCGFSDAEPVIVRIRNYSADTLRHVPVTYATAQDTVTEAIPVILPHDSVDYSFAQKADLSVFGPGTFHVWVAYPPDFYHNNDSSATIYFHTSPVIASYPYLEGFESGDGYWFSGGLNSSWAWGAPQKRLIHEAANGRNAWVTNLTGNYADNQYSFLYSPCFDLTSLAQPVLSFSHIFQMEDDCSCDFHWVEYSLDDSAWTRLGAPGAGTNWYDNADVGAWQLSDTIWHVSSFDIPVNPAKIRFRFVMYADPATDYEGVGIDDIHIFEKAPVYDSTNVPAVSVTPADSGWTDFSIGESRIASINPNGQRLGTATAQLYADTTVIRDTTAQYYPARNLVIRVATPPTAPVGLRFYFTDRDARRLRADSGCANCPMLENAYHLGVTQYSSSNTLEEDSTLNDNLIGNYLYHLPRSEVQVIPQANGYYAEYQVKGFSEFWLNGGGPNHNRPLAAWLTSFTAVRADSLGNLAWTVWPATTGRFLVQSSADSLRYNTVATIAAGADTAYGATATLFEGATWFRIVLVTPAGDTLKSPVRRLDYQVAPGGTPGVYPNPSSGWIIVETESECLDIQLFDLRGRRLLTRQTSGLQQKLDLHRLARGLYLLRIHTTAGYRTVKVERN